MPEMPLPTRARCRYRCSQWCTAGTGTGGRPYPWIPRKRRVDGSGHHMHMYRGFHGSGFPTGLVSTGLGFPRVWFLRVFGLKSGVFTGI